MLSNMWMPLRTVTGPSIPIEHARVIRASPEMGDPSSIQLALHNSLSDIVDGLPYGQFLPLITAEIDAQGGTPATAFSVTPADGVATFPVPPGLEDLFGLTPDYLSLFWLPKDSPETDDARKLWCEIEINLPRQRAVLGGIAYTGYPFLPFLSIDNASNFGLPREISISWQRDDDPGFLDAETSLVNQEPTSHSGMHILKTGPVAITGARLVLRISDFPKIIRQLDYRRSAQGLVRTVHDGFGFLIPFLAIFEYREGTRFSPSVSSGLLAVRQPPTDTRPGDPLLRLTTGEAVLVSSAGTGDPTQLNYRPLSASAALGRPRTYQTLTESFLSNDLAAGETLCLYLEQGEEYERCVAGFRIRFGISSFDQFPGLASPLRITAYEIDPLDGMTPASVGPPGKYASLAGTTECPGTLNTSAVLRLVRPSNCRFFALQFTNIGKEPGSVVIANIQVVRSFDVSARPKPARNLEIRALHFRLVGPLLGDDYSQLGPDQFSLSVERVTAGQVKNVVFEAHSLADLLHSGAARLLGNVRRRGVEDETVQMSEQIGPNHERRTLQTRSEGWRTTRTGGNFPAGDNWDTQLSQDAAAYESYGNQEIRTHSRLLYPDNSIVPWLAAGTYFNALAAVFTTGRDLAAFTRPDTFNRAFQDGPLLKIPDSVELYAGWSKYWQGLVDRSGLRVSGLRSYQQSPFGPVELTGDFVKKLISGTSAAVRLFGDLAAGHMNLLDVPGLLNRLAALGDTAGMLTLLFTALQGPGQSALSIPFLNGFNLSISGQPAGLGVTASSVALLPSVVETSAEGTTGQITLQASRSGTAFSKQRGDGFDYSHSLAELESGVSNRRIEHREVSGTDAKRVRGAEVMWQGAVSDIITGTIPVRLSLPASNARMYLTQDDWLRVRFPGGIRGLSVDVWLEVVEEVVRDDY